MKPTLLILAAGMGSRYGKLKQLDAFGPNGETIIDYSLYDAIRAGFGKVVFVVRDAFKTEFKEIFSKKLHGKIDMEFVSQELHKIPDGFELPDERSKPWGTAHAVWVAKDVINEPFGVINADDYYGVEAFRQLADFLLNAHKSDNYGVVAYNLENTLSDHGTVNRGVCQMNADGFLSDVKECEKIRKQDDGVIRYKEHDAVHELLPSTLVSMNMWGFLPSYFDHFDENFKNFLLHKGHELTSEYYIPALVDHLIKNEILQVEIIETGSDWFGVTYQEDRPVVMEKLRGLIDKGVYPENLWNAYV
ncbi:MAG TPA: sugar phosphate nucleotidyltransferase [Saprospiraceae bacterium]|nr:sugar phosphate nucleotidyltransferase [Saprospiraceae bacterium]HRP42700.1 sugar phosphate nucleotidyltransferase [Saprospiraceae bacterium]